jgi:hypothetical protein
MRREKTQINKNQKGKRGDNNKHQENSGNHQTTLKTYITINLKILTKEINL